MNKPGSRARVGFAVSLAAGLVIASLSGWLRAAEGESGPIPVLILNSGTSISLASQQLEHTVRQELAHAGIGALEFFSEGLDATTTAGAPDDMDVVSFLANKYRHRPPKLVVVIGRPAISFMQRQRRALWPQARVVFAGLAVYGDGALEPLPFPGVAFRADPVETVSVARALVPNLRRVLVVSGASEFDRAVLSATARALGVRSSGADIEYLRTPTLAELFATVQTLPSDTVVLYTTMYRDEEGQTFASRDLLMRLAELARVPVFTLYESYIGAGAIGGAVVSWEQHSREAGLLAARVLSSKAPPANEVAVSGRAGCVVDSRQLARWNIAAGLVPASCEVRFSTQAVQQPNRLWISGGVALGVALTVIGALFLVQLHRQRRTDEELQLQRDELAHAARLAMIGELTASIAHEINQPLGAILSNADAAEMILESQPQRTGEVRRILADIRRDDLRASEVIRHIRTLLRKSGIEAKRVVLNEVIADVLRLIGPDAERRGVIVVHDLARELPDVLADAVHLRQVVLNLILNAMDAMKNVEPDRRRVSVRTLRDGERIVVAVADCGPGIAPDRLDRVFQSFYTTKEEGLGLGLSIARYLVEANHGRLWAENAIGGGAVFQFSLPVLAAAQPVTSEVESAA